MSLELENIGNLYIGLLASASFLGAEYQGIQLAVRSLLLTGCGYLATYWEKSRCGERIFGYRAFELNDSGVYKF
jgi:hypothetical protein